MASTSQQIEILKSFCTVERLERLQQAAFSRTLHFVIALEDIYDPHNASAVLRSAEAFGLYQVYIIENRHAFTPKTGVSLSSEQWLHLQRFTGEKKAPWANTQKAFKHLHKLGYQIAATTPRAKTYLQDINFNKPTAFVFGSEKEGLSSWALKHADVCFQIPMQGLVESLNLSVAAAVVLFYALEKAKENQWLPPLAKTEKEKILLRYLKLSVKASEKILQRHFSECIPKKQKNKIT